MSGGRLLPPPPSSERGLLRRSSLKVAAVTLLLALAMPGRVAAPATGPGALPLTITATPIARFDLSGTGPDEAGPLRFRGGLVLSARDERFGGFSGVSRSPDGSRLVAISDRARWLVATPVYSNGRLSGLEAAMMAPILSATGTPLGRTRSYDTEALTIAGGAAYIGIERTHEVQRFEWARDGVMARGQQVAVPAAIKGLPANRGIEGIGIAPPASPIAGAIVAIAERSDGPDDPTRGFILTGAFRGTFLVSRRDRFDITDLAFLDNGDMLVLERFYAPFRGLGMRIRHIAGRTIKPGALLDGRVLIEADLGQQIDNMEGMSLHRDPATGETVLTLISDDNFSVLQRTILLEFTLVRN